MILVGQSIRELGIVIPTMERTVKDGMTFGLSPAGYDVRVEFDSQGLNHEMTLDVGDFLLASTVEYFRMPTDLLGVVHDKSTWARRGLAVQNTVIEPGWHGYLTLELTNHGREPVTIMRGSPIAQILFHVLSEPVEGYQGKYQNQSRGPREPINE